MAGRIQRDLWAAAIGQYGYVTSTDARRLDINPKKFTSPFLTDDLEARSMSKAGTRGR